MALSTTLSRVVGTTLQTNAQFKDFSNHVVVPSSVELKYKKPNATIVTSVPVTSITNTYSTTVLLDEVGVWSFRWECSGSYASAEEFQVNVEKSIVL